MLEISAVADDLPEEAEVFHVFLYPPEGGAALGAIRNRTLIIERNDSPYGLVQIYVAGSKLGTHYYVKNKA